MSITSLSNISTCMLFRRRISKIVGIMIVFFVSQNVSAASGGVVEQAGIAEAPPPTNYEPAWSDQAPILTEEQRKVREMALERSHLPGPPRPAGRVNAERAMAPAVPLKESYVGGIPAPSASPSDFVRFRSVDLKSIVPSGNTSNVMESSTGVGGKYAFYTGNWFAARSVDGGASWTYVNPYNDMPNFCCDQVTLYDQARNMFIWYRQNSADANGNNFVRVGISTDGGASFCNYDFAPSNLGFSNQWYDYPHLQLGANFLYIATNIFNSADVWQRTAMLKLPLDSLKTCAGFSYSYYTNTGWFTWVPVQGADHQMYFASNWPTSGAANRLGIWKWKETNGALTFYDRTLSFSWTNTTRDSAVCGSTSGNWAARTDDRVLTGARYRIQGSNVDSNGRTVLGWWWNVAQGGKFPRPYVEGAAFIEDSLTQIGGSYGRPLMWNSSDCFLYPSIAANKRGDLGVLVHWGYGTNLNPNVAYGIQDDYVPAPPGWSIRGYAASTARPSDNKWGDYNTARAFSPTGETWIGATHYITGTTTNCSACSSPLFVEWGRERDRESWSYWQNK